MFLALQFILASMLIASGSALTALWLVLIASSYVGQSGLMPWVAAGVILYGWFFVAAAAVISVPGILWLKRLASRVPTKWVRVAKVLRRIGWGALVLGFVVAVAVVAIEKFRAKDPLNGCVSYRDAAAQAAIATPGAKPEIDCPVQK